MNREIKFRAYVTVHGISAPSIGGYEHYNKMIPVAGYLIDYILDADGLEYSYLDDTLIALMQYTGLKDKNGVEIYEGDIVRVTHKIGDSDVREMLPNDFGFFAYVDHGNCKLEVIGNIYENPEILKEETE